MRFLKWSIIVVCTMQCGSNYVSPYDEVVFSISEHEIQAYLNTICLSLGGHIGYEAIGRCSQCGGMTPCCNMQICDRCAAARGVCPFCLKKVDWTKNTDPEKEVPLLLAALARSEDIRARQVAVYALTQIKHEGTLDFMMRYANEPKLSLELSRAIGSLKNEHYIPYLHKILERYAGDQYFGEGDIEEQYYFSGAAQEAAMSLAAINSKRTVDILLRAAKRGQLWERVFAIRALTHCRGDKVRVVLNQCLEEFFSKDDDWKWIPGRDLIGATLEALVKVGDKKTALLIIECIRNPGCDFLYQELKQCLVAIGQPAIPELCNILRQDFEDGLFDWGRLSLIEAMGEMQDTSAVPFLQEVIHMTFPDGYIAGDFTHAAQRSLDMIAQKKAETESQQIQPNLLLTK